MPGIPTNIKPIDEKLKKDELYPGLNNDAVEFFKKRGYKHNFNNCNCFDMRVDLSNENLGKNNIGDTIDGINYRWANIEDKPKIIECVEDAFKKFTRWYIDEELYNAGNNKRILIAENQNQEVCGTILVSYEKEDDFGRSWLHSSIT